MIPEHRQQQISNAVFPDTLNSTTNKQLEDSGGVAGQRILAGRSRHIDPSRDTKWCRRTQCTPGGSGLHARGGSRYFTGT